MAGRYHLFRRIIAANLNMVMGQYADLLQIDESIERFVFVCRGNVCRSPYAEAAAISMGFQAISCGVDVLRSAPAESLAVHAASLRGKNVCNHFSRSIFSVPLKASDCLVAMDSSHLPAVRTVAAKYKCHATLMGLWKKPIVSDIPDPYGKCLTRFQRCFDEIDECLIGLSMQQRNRNTSFVVNTTL